MPRGQENIDGFAADFAAGKFLGDGQEGGGKIQVAGEEELFEVAAAVFDQLDADFGEAAAKDGEPAGEEEAAADKRQAEAQDVLAQAAHFLELGAEVVALGEDGFGFLEHEFAGGGEPILAADAVQQLKVQLVFELLNGLADGGLGDVEAAGGAGETAFADHGDECFQGAELHGYSFKE